jgi:RecA-family ATPase
MAAGKPLLGVTVPRPLRVLLINLEDNRAAMDKRIAAAMQHYGLSASDIGGRLFIKAKGELEFKIARQLRSGSVVRDEQLIKGMIAFIIENKIDVFSIDRTALNAVQLPAITLGVSLTVFPRISSHDPK